MSTCYRCWGLLFLCNWRSELHNSSWAGTAQKLVLGQIIRKLQLSVRKENEKNSKCHKIPYLNFVFCVCLFYSFTIIENAKFIYKIGMWLPTWNFWKDRQLMFIIHNFDWNINILLSISGFHCKFSFEFCLELYLMFSEFTYAYPNNGQSSLHKRGFQL